MFARLAEVSQSPTLHFEAGFSWLMAGNRAAALQHLEQSARAEPFATTVAPAIAVLKALTGAHAEAIALLATLPERDATTDHALGIALRGVGRIAEALGVFEHILRTSPWHAGALQQAALCCYDLGRTVEGTRHAKKAARLGRPVARPPRRRRTRDPAGAPPASA
jgi:tetratricopeptide (TPR) repeat protein